MSDITDQQPESETGSAFLDETMKGLRERIDELRPLVEEYTKLEGALHALGGPVEDVRPAAPQRRGRRNGGK